MSPIENAAVNALIGRDFDDLNESELTLAYHLSEWITLKGDCLVYRDHPSCNKPLTNIVELATYKTVREAGK